VSLPAEAQVHLDAANALFAGRYRAGLDHLGRWAVTDRQKNKLVGVDRDPVKATRRALTSARLSANNGNRRDDTPEWRSIPLPPALWAVLDAEAKAAEIKVSELIRQKLLR